MLPSPERTLLCKKIGFYDRNCDQLNIDQQFNLRMGNFSFSLTHDSKEVLLLTLTQTNFSYNPNLLEDTFKALLKIEGLILEGSNEEEQLISIMASEHLSTSPAYFFKAELEKMPANSNCSYKFNLALDSVECLYNQVSS